MGKKKKSTLEYGWSKLGPIGFFFISVMIAMVIFTGYVIATGANIAG